MTQLEKMNRNVKLYLLIQPFLGLLFTIPVWVSFQQRFLTYTGMSLMESGSFILNLLFELPSGVAADLLGRKKTMILGWIMIALGYITEGFSFNILVMMIGYGFVAIGGAFVSGSDEALFYDSLKELKREDEYPVLNARVNLYYRLAMIGAMFTGGFLYSVYFGLPYIFRGLGVVAATIMALFMTEPYIDTEKFSANAYFAKLRKGVSALKTDSYILWLSIYYVIMAGVSWSCLYYFNNPFAKDVGYDEIGQSYLYAGLYIVTTAMILFITSKKKLLNKKLVFIVYPLILIAGLAPGIFAGKILAGILLGLVILAGGARFSILHAFVNQEIDSSHRATSLSLLSMLVSLFCALAIGGLGWVQHDFGTPMVFTILGGIVILFGLPATFFVVRHQSRLRYNAS